MESEGLAALSLLAGAFSNAVQGTVWVTRGVKWRMLWHLELLWALDVGRHRFYLNHWTWLSWAVSRESGYGRCQWLVKELGAVRLDRA